MILQDKKMVLTWDDIGKNKSYNLDNYFKLSRGDSKIKFRPLGDLYTFKKYMFEFGNRWRIAVCLDEDTCPAARKHNIIPSVRYAINVIDRRDNTIKILETSIKVVKQMKVFFEKTGKEPGATNGAHYYMSFVERKGRWVYSADFAGAHTLSDEDINLIKTKGLFKLNQIYKATSPKIIEQVLFGDMINKHIADNKVNKNKFSI